MRLPFALLVCTLMHTVVRAQVFMGGGYGTFNVPGASEKFRGFGPTFRCEYIEKNERISLYLDASYFEKTMSQGTTEVYDRNGVPQGQASVNTRFSYVYNVIGSKILLVTTADEKKINPYVGGGFDFIYAQQRTSYQPSYDAGSGAHGSMLYGLQLNTGIQYCIQPVIIELRGNLDFVFKPLVDDNSNILTNLRLSAMIPL
ncbi:hypothetical protein [Dinghuibacter silviterrae]|uniref:Outer membrane protein with beta-barrel domain n=1 Tax=Dinghuibacter silviterrae TaxID=1539049 RepID=A0A4R8DWK0_9BACT|nr:hypothetical protein [Dinghuibacter silviterrae]TDX02318.1 hypothetical protein EDB95_3374 [Dinghuibacter silviterrae]